MMRGHLGGIKVEIHNARRNAGLLPLVIHVTGGHERQLSPYVSQLRSGQTIDKRLPIASYPPVIHRKKVKRGAKPKLYLFRSGSLHDLGCHAVPGDGTTLHDIGRINLDGICPVMRRPIVQSMSLRIGASIVSFVSAPVQ
jgi:hypothetical protein